MEVMAQESSPTERRKKRALTGGEEEEKSPHRWREEMKAITDEFLMR
jgi:hypothetical protein